MGFKITGHMSDEMRVLLETGHSHGLVVLSMFIASAAGYVALVMADRLGGRDRVARGRELWRWVGAICLGGGIWSMHFIAMLAYQTSVPLRYDPVITLLSLVIAVLASYLVMRALGRRQLRYREYAFASIAAGLGIASMHYLGMAAIRSEAIQVYDPLLFVLSILIAVAVSLVALLLGGFFRDRRGRGYLWLRLLASLVMGAAITSMHYTGMAALTLAVPEGAVLDPVGPGIPPTLLAGGIGTLTLFLIVTGIAASWAEQRLRAHRRDIRSMSHQLDTVSQYDPVTELLNRRALQRVAENLFDIGATRDVCRAVLLVNVDNFKRINSSLGQHAGDVVLQTIGQRLRHMLGEADVLARFSADEFCVLAEGVDADSARVLGRRMQAQLGAPLSVQGSQLQLTAGIGYSVYPDDGTCFENVLNGAALALAYAKSSGRGRCLRYSPALKVQTDAELLIEQRLRQAINKDALEVHYQPIVDCATGDVVSLEALLRWPEMQSAGIGPDQFVAVAEHHGFSAQLDGWVLNRVCLDSKRLHELGYGRLRIAINCSAMTLTEPELIPVIEAELARHGVHGSALSLEITENALMESVTTVAGVLHSLRQLGVSVSIDDFGTGYSSLAYLHRLPVDTLKVDRSFVRDIPEQPRDGELTAGIIALAHKLGLKVVAEGVETEAQRVFLRENGCDRLQGYLFSRPQPFAELQQWLGTHAHAERADSVTSPPPFS